jgi:hypothetical protein
METFFSLNRSSWVSINPSFKTDFKNVHLTLVKVQTKKVLPNKPIFLRLSKVKKARNRSIFRKTGFYQQFLDFHRHFKMPQVETFKFCQNLWSLILYSVGPPKTTLDSLHMPSLEIKASLGLPSPSSSVDPS